VAREVNGTWHNYITVPGTASHPGSSGAQVASLSCPAPGECTVAGSYISSGRFLGFLASEVNGTWHYARAVPGLANLYGSGSGQVTALSCTRPGDCSGGDSAVTCELPEGLRADMPGTSMALCQVPFTSLTTNAWA
jgi:hypothetical protein